MHLLASVCVLILICGGGCWSVYGVPTGGTPPETCPKMHFCSRLARILLISAVFCVGSFHEFFPLWFFLSFPSFVSSVNPRCFTGLCSEDEERLVRDLFRGYNKLIRPVQNMTEKVHVNFGLAFVQLINVVSDYSCWGCRMSYVGVAVRKSVKVSRFLCFFFCIFRIERKFLLLRKRG